MTEEEKGNCVATEHEETIVHKLIIPSGLTELEVRLLRIERNTKTSVILKVINSCCLFLFAIVLLLSINGVFYSVEDMKDRLWSKTPKDATSVKNIIQNLPPTGDRGRGISMDSGIAVRSVYYQS